ncbi:hypothetical protein ACFUJR_05525 [Streptomyces sp. NPDC057271]|uniref:hypothetical protein n=1 Tax=unclassified Streptomyces TaxID=2593676 RepID=UPI003642C8E8
MKQSAAKTLGVAALGAAFAAAAAGTATAAPSLPATPDALGLVTKTVPLGDVAELPDGAAESLLSGQSSVDQGVKTLPAAAGAATQHLPLDAANGPLASTPVGGLLGGLPVGALPLG